MLYIFLNRVTVSTEFSVAMSPNHNNGEGLMHYSTSIYLRADQYRRQATEARQRAEQALDQSSTKAAFEEVANHWVALAEQVEWLARARRAASRAEVSRGFRMLLGVAALGLAGFAILVAIGLWDRYSLEAETLGFSGIYERNLASQAGFRNDPQGYRAVSAAARASQAVGSRPADSRQRVAIEE
jgi:hypothetical protein